MRKWFAMTLVRGQQQKQCYSIPSFGAGKDNSCFFRYIKYMYLLWYPSYWWFFTDWRTTNEKTLMQVHVHVYWNDLVHLFLIRMLVIELKKRLQWVKLCSTWNVGVWRWSSLIGGDTSLWNFKMVWYTTSKCYLMHEHVEIVIWIRVCSIISVDMINHNKLSVLQLCIQEGKHCLKLVL